MDRDPPSSVVRTPSVNRLAATLTRTQNASACLARYCDLHALGWREGENLHVEWRFANGDPASLPRLAAELVALRPDVLVAGGTIETKALQAATSDIPIVFHGLF